jgi:hypothetical protein
MMLAAAWLGDERVTFRRIDPARAAGQLWVVAGEEFGWRGFFLPRLRRLMPPVVAVPVMTAAWGGWHLPMLFVSGSPQAEDQPTQFAAAIFAWSAIHHLLQIRRPSVATAMAFHAAANITADVEDGIARPNVEAGDRGAPDALLDDSEGRQLPVVGSRAAVVRRRASTGSGPVIDRHRDRWAPHFSNPGWLGSMRSPPSLGDLPSSAPVHETPLDESGRTWFSRATNTVD